jgi:hypothetical protein
MKQLTIRGIPDEVEEVIEREARRRRKSKNKIVVSLLEQATGVKPGKSNTVVLYHDLDHLSGLWSAKEAERFEKHLTKQRKIDEDLWE